MKRQSTVLSVLLSVAALVTGIWLHVRATAPQAPRSTGASTAHEPAAGATRSRVDRLPATLAPVMMQTLQAESGSSYNAVAISASTAVPVASFEAPNPAQAFTTRFDSRGLTIHPNAASRQPLALRLAAYGSSERSPAIAMQGWTATGLRLERKSADPARPLVEWYVNGTLGLEQGFTVSSPPDGSADTLVLQMAVGNGWTARGAGEAIQLTENHGAGRLRYDHLFVVDAAGAVLPAAMTAERGGIVVRVEAAGAQYPVTIDPFVQQAQLLVSDGTSQDYFGNSVAVDGDTAVVGAPSTGSNSRTGVAYVFVRSGGTWTLQAKLAGDTPFGRFGSGVAVSGDTIVVGAFSSNAAYVFVRTGTTWSQQARLTVSDAYGNARFGAYVALSGDTAVVSAHGDDLAPSASSAGYVADAGSAYVFVRNGIAWTQQAKLVAGDPQTSDLFAGDNPNVAVDGDTVVIGAAHPFGTPPPGKAYVFVRTGTAWSQQQKLTASDGANGDRFGGSVAVSGDTAVIGAYSDDVGANVDQGSAYVFVRSGGVWTEQQRLTASDGATSDMFGSGAAVSGDAVVIGARRDNVGSIGDQGSAYVFTRSGTTWTENSRLTASDGASSDEFGYAVALSGTTAVVGAYLHNFGANFDQGSAYVFLFSSNSTPTIAAAAALTRQQGSPAGAAAQIATVSDADQSAGSLSVTGSAPAGTSVTGVSNVSGVITATVAAACSATAGANIVPLTVTDSAASTATANLTVNVTANTPPTVGSYPAGTVNAGEGATVTPSAATADNGSVDMATASAPGFSGVLSVNLAGVVTVSNAGPAGLYTVTVTFWDNCGAATSQTFDLKVNKRDPAITWNNPADIVYGTALSGTQLNATADVAGSFTYTPPAGTVLNAGDGQTLAVSFAPTDATNYNPASKAVAISVARASVTATLSAAGKTYDRTTAEPDENLSCTLTGVLAADSGNVSCTAANGTFDGANAGAHTVTATVTIGGPAASNYTLGAAGTTSSSTSATASATIAAKSLTASITADGKPYDGTTAATIHPVLGAGVVASDVVTVSGTGTFDTKTAGTAKTVTSSDLALGGADAGNYSLSSATATTAADITKAAATIAVTAYHVTFDGNPHTATGSASGADGEDLSTLLHLAGTAQTNAGDYLTAPWTFDGDANHNAANGTVHDVIDKAASITSVSCPASVTYTGAAQDVCTATVTGAGGLSLTPTPVHTANTQVGTANASHTYGGDANYATSSDSQSFSIAKKSASVTAAAATKVYGGADPAFSGSTSGFVASDAVTAIFTRGAGEAVGSYAIGATLAPAGVLDNYDITYHTATFAITAATLVVTANPASKLLGDADPLLTYQVTGWQFGDTGATVLSGALTRDAGEAIGSYTIRQGTLASNGNYAISFTTGTLTIGYNTCLLYDPAKAVKSGATIPIKIALCSAGGVNASASTIVVTATHLTLESTSTSGQVSDAGNSNADGNFRFDTGLGPGYIFNLKTTGLSRGTYLLHFTVSNDPQTHAVRFQVQ